MSVPDHELDPDDRSCQGCDRPIARGRYCLECRLDNEDLYADMKIRDAKEGK